MARRDQPRNTTSMAELRKRAEAILNSEPEHVRELDPSDIQALIQDLQIHQIELEIQNEELRETQIQLADARDRFWELYALSPVPYITTRMDGYIEQANPAAAALVRVDLDQLIGGNVGRFLAGESQDVAYVHRQAARESASQTAAEVIILTADGEVLSVRMETVASQRNAALICLTALIDLTEQLRSEEALRERERRFRELAESMPHVVWAANPDGVIYYYNSRVGDFADLRLREDGSLRWTYIVHPDDVEGVSAAWHDAVTRGVNYQCEHRMCMADGQERWYLSRAVPVRDANGDVERWYGSSTDIHDIKLTEAALRESEERLQLAAVAAQFGAYDHDLVGGRSVWSPQLYAMIGLPEDLPPSIEAARGFVHPDDRPLFEAMVAAALDNERSGHYEGEYRIRSTRGEVRWFHDVGQVFFEDDGQSRRPVRIIGTVRDVTDRREAQDALKESEARFRTMADNLPLIIWVHDAEGRQTMVNQTFCAFFGLTPEEAAGDWWHALIHPDDAGGYTREFLAANREHRPFRGQARVRDGSGRWRWIESWGRPRFHESGEYLGMIGASVDITARKEIETAHEQLRRTLEQQVQERSQELIDERNFVDTVLQKVPTPVVLLDLQGNIVRFNQACELASGYRLEELQQQADWVDKLIPADEQDDVQAALQRLPDGDVQVSHENHWIHRDGSRRLFTWNNVLLKAPRGEAQYILATGADLTELRKAEHNAREFLDEAARLQRLQTVNELGTHLAHEINQPLTAIGMFAEAGREALSGIPEDVAQPITGSFQNIIDQSLRAGETIRHMRGFLRSGEMEKRPFELDPVIRRAAELVQVLAKRNQVRIVLDLPAELPRLEGVDVHIEQVILNLLRNAVESIREAGMSEGEVRIHTRQEGQVVRVTVEDTGPGIDEEKASRLFTPLFTTKREGLGVGLAISRSLIEAHGGRLWVEPRIPGALMHFTLPCPAE